MAITTHLDIVSAEREIFSGVVTMVVATGELGEIGVVPGHAPLLTLLKPGEIRVTLQNGEQDVYYVSGGMLEVQPYYVSVLADEVELPAGGVEDAAGHRLLDRLDDRSAVLHRAAHGGLLVDRE